MLYIMDVLYNACIMSEHRRYIPFRIDHLAIQTLCKLPEYVKVVGPCADCEMIASELPHVESMKHFIRQ